MKWGGGVLSGLLTLILALLSVFAAIGLYRLYAPRGGPVQAIQVAGTPEQVARGEHLAYIDCVQCHSTNSELPLSGGQDVGADAPLPLGSFVSVNLTPAGPLKDWSDGEILRTLREGVDRDGRWLVAMSAISARNFSDEDLQAIVAYLRSQLAVTNETPDPPDQPNLLFAIFLGARLVPQEPQVTGVITAPPKGATAEHGEYIVRFMGCRNCHGPDLGGGTGGLLPVGPNLRVVQGWTLDQFIATLRTGVDPGGHKLSDQMPWRPIGRMDDEELGALYAYLHSLPPVQKRPLRACLKINHEDTKARRKASERSGGAARAAHTGGAAGRRMSCIFSPNVPQSRWA